MQTHPNRLDNNLFHLVTFMTIQFYKLLKLIIYPCNQFIHTTFKLGFFVEKHNIVTSSHFNITKEGNEVKQLRIKSNDRKT